MIYTNNYDSPLGRILLAGDEEGLTGLWFTEGSRYCGLGLKKGAVPRETGYFDQTKQWLDLYFTGHDPGFIPKIHLTGSDGLPIRLQRNAGLKRCLHRLWAARSVIIRSVLSYPATGWSAQTEA